MFKLARLEITGFKSFADHTEIVFTGSGITAVVGPNGCGKSNVSDAISWVLGEQRAKSLRGGEMKDVVFQGTKNRKPGGMAEVILHLVRDDTVFDIDESELEDIDETLSDIDQRSIDIDAFAESDVTEADGTPRFELESEVETEEVLEFETVRAAQVGSVQTVEKKVRPKRHWRPRSFALDFAPGEAVSVTRRLYLSGESEYQLNGRTCRLRDITDLFAGTGLSGAHYAIVEQGRIGQILSAKPADRRSLIEEAAGISKFRARQRAAESRLDAAKINLGRISDIVSEIDKQVNSLRRQAGKTRRFKILQEEFRALLRQLYAAEGKYLSELAQDLSRQLGEAAESETSIAVKVSEQENASREATQLARDAEESLAELRKIHADNALERDRAEREHVYKSEQVVNLNNRSEALRGEISGSRQRLDLYSTELERLKQEEIGETAEFVRADTELRTAEEANLRESKDLLSIEETLEVHRQELLRHTAAVERFDEIKRQLQFNVEKLESRFDGLGKESLRAAQTVTEHKRHLDDVSSSLESEQAKLAGFNAEKEELMIKSSEALNTLRSAESELQEISDNYSAKRHRLVTLQELEEKRAVYTPQVQKIFSEQQSIGVELIGVLADRLKVDLQAEAAVEALFGHYLESILVGSLEDARRLSKWLRKNGIGRTTMLVCGRGDSGPSINPRKKDAFEHLLGAAPDFLNDLRRAFPREMSARFVESLDVLSDAAEGIVVDRQGDVLVDGRIFISGDGRAEGGNESLLSFKRELHELDETCRLLAGDVERRQQEVEQARAVLVEREGKMVDLQSLIIKIDRGIHGLNIQLRAAREDVERSERHLRLAETESEQTASEIEDLRRRISDSSVSASEAISARQSATDALEIVSTQLNDARLRVETTSKELSERRMAAATSGERKRSVQSAIRRVENESKELESRLALQNLEIADAEARINSLHSAIVEITDRVASADAEIESEKNELAAAIEGLATAREKADELSTELGRLNRQAADTLNHRAEIEVRQAETTTQLRNLIENCQQELNLPLADLFGSIELDDSFDLNSAKSEADSLKQRLDNFGAINMLALEELGESEERLLFLTSQRKDIVESMAATEAALREIKERSRERFRSAFESINENFVEFFRELFGGGQGRMTLLEAEDVLEAGIEVVAQPPGKRLQNILLLSGGEKAMTAIALVMAIFKYRPSPFCLLDEVDAPLDEANVGRFVGKIAEMAEKTQFIVITHNKRTMEAARALYGVTMQEAGVSKVVSVKFD
jgi:chromosome segregation protein